MTKLKIWSMTFLTLAGVAVIEMKGSGYGPRVSAETGLAAQQNAASLDRRINMLEQKFYFIESRINRLEQQSALAVRPMPSTDLRKQEIDLLRNEIDTVKGHINEIECGLAKLDERTLTASMRESRRQDSRLFKDPCRLEPESPLRLSARP
jgi:hypothetical protein